MVEILDSHTRNLTEKDTNTKMSNPIVKESILKTLQSVISAHDLEGLVIDTDTEYTIEDLIDEMQSAVLESLENLTFEYQNTSFGEHGVGMMDQNGIPYGEWNSKLGSSMENQELIKLGRKIIPW